MEGKIYKKNIEIGSTYLTNVATLGNSILIIIVIGMSGFHMI